MSIRKAPPPKLLTFGAALRNARRAAGLTLRDASAELEVDIVVLSEIERGVHSSLPPESWPRVAALILHYSSPGEVES